MELSGRRGAGRAWHSSSLTSCVSRYFLLLFPWFSHFFAFPVFFLSPLSSLFPCPKCVCTAFDPAGCVLWRFTVFFLRYPNTDRTLVYFAGGKKLAVLGHPSMELPVFCLIEPITTPSCTVRPRTSFPLYFRLAQGSYGICSMYLINNIYWVSIRSAVKRSNPWDFSASW